MSTGFWAGSVPPWAWVIGGCLAVVIFIAGIGVGGAWERAEAAAERAGERAARQVRGWRVPAEVVAPARPRPRRTSTEAFLRPPPEVAHEAWLAHTEQALDLANDGQGIHLAPADDAFLAGLHARLDNWLDENVYGGAS